MVADSVESPTELAFEVEDADEVAEMAAVRGAFDSAADGVGGCQVKDLGVEGEQT